MSVFNKNKAFVTSLYYFPVIGTERINGVTTKKYGDKRLFYGSFKTYGGTDVQKNGVYAVEDTASIETWYDPMFDSGGRVALACAENKVYEILGEPEDIEQRHQYSVFKVRRIKGGP